MVTDDESRRLRELALALGRKQPDYAVRTNWSFIRIRMSIEDLTVLRGLAAEAGTTAEEAAYQILRASIGVDRRLVRKVFFGEDSAP